MISSVDLILNNANVFTLDAHQPRADALAICGQTIVAVGTNWEIAGLKHQHTRVIDCQGMSLIPGFVDAHIHLLPTAATLTGLDFSPDAVTSVSDLQKQLKLRAANTSSGSWIRGFGYDHLSLADGRHPTRWDLDKATHSHPVRIDHRSGHATVLNSLGMELANISRDTPDPVEGIIDRDEATGEPTGLILEAAGFLRSRLGITRNEGGLAEGINRLNNLLLRYGVTSVQDAGPNNNLNRWETFQSLTQSGELRPRVTMMAGASNLDQFTGSDLSWGVGNNGLRLGHAKIMLTLTTGALTPGVGELKDLVVHCHNLGFPVAIHAVEQEAIEAAVRVLTEVRVSSGSLDESDRIEHCGECPPQLIHEVHLAGVTVVTQPGFIYWNGDTYVQRVKKRMLPHLYPVGSLSKAGIPMAFGSDAPVIDANPWAAITGAVTRITKTGKLFPSSTSSEATHDLTVMDALRMHTLGGALAEGTGSIKGSLTPGKLADMVLLDVDPTTIYETDLKDVRAIATFIGGMVVWNGTV